MPFLFNPLHYAIHHGLRWNLASTFDFARNEGWVSIARSEVRRLSFHNPVLIVERARDWLPVVPIAAEGLAQCPLNEDGTWRRGAPPMALAFHPFQTVPDSSTGEPVLAVAHDPQTVREDGGYAFFDENGRPTRQVRAVLRRQQQIGRERRQLSEAAAALGRADLLEPVPHLRDRQGRTPFRTLSRAAFSAFPRERLTTLGPQPNHTFMLAAALVYGSRNLSTETSPSIPIRSEPTSETVPPPQYGDEMELVFNF